MNKCRPVREKWTMRTEFYPLPEPIAEPETSRLDRIKLLVRSITWGEMMQLGAGIARTGGGGEITKSDLPNAFLLWAMERK